MTEFWRPLIVTAVWLALTAAMLWMAIVQPQRALYCVGAALGIFNAILEMVQTRRLK